MEYVYIEKQRYREKNRKREKDRNRERERVGQKKGERDSEKERECVRGRPVVCFNVLHFTTLSFPFSYPLSPLPHISLSASLSISLSFSELSCTTPKLRNILPLQVMSFQLRKISITHTFSCNDTIYPLFMSSFCVLFLFNGSLTKYRNSDP